MTGGQHFIDAVDRKIVAALQQNGRAGWTEIARRLDLTVATTSRRGSTLITDGVVRVACMPFAEQAGPAQRVMLRIRCAPGEQHRVAAHIATRPDVRFLALVTGSCDIMAEIVVPRPDQLHTVLIQGLQSVPGILGSEATLMLHTYKVSHDWSRHLLPDDGAQDTGSPHECDMSHFDDVDLRILDVMRNDGRAGFKTVAAAIGVNESTVRRRFEAMSRRGCVSVVTLVPAAALGFEAEIMLWLDIRPSQLDAVAHELTSHVGVRYLAATLENSSLLCEVILPTPHDVFEFTNHTLAAIDGLRGWSANVELLTVKRGFVLTPWSSEHVQPPPTDTLAKTLPDARPSSRSI